MFRQNAVNSSNASSHLSRSSRPANIRLFLWLAIALTFIVSVPAPVSYGAPSEDTSAANALHKLNSGVSRFVLDNGMICLVKSDRSAPVVAVQIWVRTGSMDESEYLGAGLSHYIEHMIFKGTPTRGPGEIARQINDAGGSINAYTSFDRTVFYVNMPSDKWRTGLEILGDAVMNASFPEDEWKREKQVILREIAMNRDNPDRELSRIMWESAFTTHPIRHPVIGYKDVFVGITREDLKTFYERNYVPNEMITVVVGDVTTEAMEQALREIFHDFQRRAKAPSILPREPEQLAPRFVKTESDSVKLSRVECAYHTVELSNPDAPALDVLASIVGAGRSSILVEKIKENMRLAHSVSAWSYTPRVPGLFGISATYDPDKEDKLLAAIESEVDSWKSDLFSKDAVRKALRTALVSELSQFQTMEGQAGAYASGEFYAGDPFFSETYISRLKSVTPEKLRDTVRKYLAPENRTIAILAPEPAEAATDGTAAVTMVPSDPVMKSLKNGLRVITREDRKLPFVYGCVVVGGGLLAESADDNGITRLMSELLTRGTKEHSAGDIARTVESLGGSLTAFSGYNTYGLQFHCLSQDMEKFASLAADCLLNPSFPEQELEKQKSVQIAAISQRDESPFYVASHAMRKLLFPGHPYRFDSLGTKETVQKLTRGDLEKFHRKTVVSRNCVLALFGALDTDAAVKLASSDFSGIPDTPAPAAECPEPNPKLPAAIENREPKQQTIFMMGFPGIDVTDPRADALMVLQETMSGLSSTILTEIRDKRGLAYYGGAYAQQGVDPGFFAVYVGTREDALPEVRKLVNSEIDRITGEGLTQEEFDRAVAQIISDHKHSLQNNAKVALECSLNELYGLGHDHVFSLARRMEELDREDVTKTAADILRPDEAAVSIVLPEQSEATQGGKQQ